MRPLRIGDEGDLDALMELYRHADWTRDRRRRDVARMLAATPFTLSAWEGRGPSARLVGFCRVLTDFTYRAVLYDVIVHTDRQGAGLGRLLMERVLSHPKLRRVTSFYLKTADKQRFYERFGWKVDAEHFMELKR